MGAVSAVEVRAVEVRAVSTTRLESIGAVSVPARTLVSTKMAAVGADPLSGRSPLYSSSNLVVVYSILGQQLKESACALQRDHSRSILLLLAFRI